MSMNATSRLRGFARFWRVGLAIVVIAVLAIGGLIAVGNRGNSSLTDNDATAAGVNEPAIVSATSASSYSAAAATSAPVPARTSNGAPAPPATAASGGSVTRSVAGANSSSDAAILGAPLPPQTIDQQIIRTATIQFTAKDVIGTQNSIWNLASELGGNVLTSNTTGSDDTMRAEIAFRVPSDRFKEALDRLHGYAVKVNQEQSSAQDVTEDYVDLQARQRNLEATVAQFQSLLTKATTVDDTLKVQVQLNNAQSDLERVKGKLNYYDQRTAFSTISATILPVPPAKGAPVTPVATWSLGHSVREAWNRSINGLQNVADALITVGIGGWWIEIPLVFAIYLLVRRERRRRPVLAPATVPVTSNDSGDRADRQQ
jgi:hypothetical protein